MFKKDIRKLYKQKRLDLSIAEKDRMEDLMLIQFQSLKLAIPDKVMTYSPIESLNEYNPILIEEYCFFKNPNTDLIYPVANFKTNTINAFQIKEDTLFETNEHHIEEPIDGIIVSPEEIELMFIPLLAFDKKGYRIGYGKGFYDNYLKNCSRDLVKVGFSFFDDIIIDDVHITDEKLNFCITANQIFEF